MWLSLQGHQGPQGPIGPAGPKGEKVHLDMLLLFFHCIVLWSNPQFAPQDELDMQCWRGISKVWKRQESLSYLKTFLFLPLSFLSSGRGGRWWEGGGTSRSSRWHSKSHLTYFFSPSHVCLLYSYRNHAVLHLLIYFVCIRDLQVTEEKEGNQEILGTKYVPSLPVRFEIFIYGYEFSNLLLCLRVKLVWMVSEVDLALRDHQWVSTQIFMHTRHKHQAWSPRLSLCVFINVTANFRDILDLEGSKDPKGPKEIK